MVHKTEQLNDYCSAMGEEAASLLLNGLTVESAVLGDHSRKLRVSIDKLIQGAKEYDAKTSPDDNSDALSAIPRRSVRKPESVEIAG